MIFVNDGSTDNSLNILIQLQKESSKITVIDQDNNGSGGARNSGLNIAKGKYIQFLDVDDRLHVAELVNLYKLALNNSVEVLGYRLANLSSENKQISVRAKHNGLPYGKLLTGLEALESGYQPSSLCIFLFDRAFLDTYNLRITPKLMHMDVEFMLRVMLKAGRVMFIDKVIYQYIHREGSITKPKTKAALNKLIQDEVKVAILMTGNKQQETTESEMLVIQKNVNSLAWNLLWRFITNPLELDRSTKVECVCKLKVAGIFPLKGPLKTRFQYFTRFFINFYIRWFFIK